MQENNPGPERSEDDAPLVPRAGVVYGDIIYWGTIAGTILVLIGSFVTFTTANNYIDPSYLLSAILEGKTVEEIWAGASGVGSQPNGHWYLSQLSTGNGLTMAGIALGVFSVTPAIFASAVVLYRDNHRFFSGIALIAGIITIAAMLP